MMRQTTVTKVGEGFVDVTEHRVQATAVDALIEHLDQFFGGEPTDAQRAQEIRAQDESNGLDSLQRLYKLAQGNSGQCQHVAAFLLGLYNGQRFRFDLTDFRCVDASIFEDMLRVLRMDNQARAEVHTYFPQGGQRFEEIANDWNLHSQTWEPSADGFSQQRNGYMCHVEPYAFEGHVHWKWYITSGGGWAWRRRQEHEIITHIEGKAWSVGMAKDSINEWFERGGETPYPREE